MALKAERQVWQTNLDHVLNQAAEPGTVLVASGVANVAAIAGDGEVGVSGIVPLGLLLNTREAFDYGKEYERLSYDTDDLGTVVAILEEGELITNKITGTPVVGEAAFLAANGNVSAVDVGADFRVGRFLTAKDSNGFAKLRVEIR